MIIVRLIPAIFLGSCACMPKMKLFEDFTDKEWCIKYAFGAVSWLKRETYRESTTP